MLTAALVRPTRTRAADRPASTARAEASTRGAVAVRASAASTAIGRAACRARRAASTRACAAPPASARCDTDRRARLFRLLEHRLHLAGAHGALERGVIALVLVGIGHGEIRDRLVEGVTLPHVSGDERR